VVQLEQRNGGTPDTAYVPWPLAMSSDEAWRQIQALEKELKLLKTSGPEFTLDHFLARCEGRLKSLQAIAGNDDLPETTALYIYDLFGTIGDLAAGLLNIENATQDLQISTEQAVRETASQMTWTDTEDDFPGKFEALQSG
jgi:hypothetical protein